MLVWLLDRCGCWTVVAAGPLWLLDRCGLPVLLSWPVASSCILSVRSVRLAGSVRSWWYGRCGSCPMNARLNIR